MPSDRKGMPVAGKKYVAIRVWMRVDPDTGDSTQYAIDDPYLSRVDDCQVAPEGPDGHGPVIAEVIAEKSTPRSLSSDSEEK